MVVAGTPFMSLLIILTCLILERPLARYQYLRHPAWLEIWLDTWLTGYRARRPPGPWRAGVWGLMVPLAPPLLLVGLLQWQLAGLALGLPGALFAVLILLYSLGPQELVGQVGELRAALEAEDRERLERAATRLLDDIPPPLTAPGFWRLLTEGVLIQAQGRYFAVLIWFLALGPVGALGYRLVAETRRLFLARGRVPLALASQRLLYPLDWPPAQVVAVLYALAGCCEPALRGWRQGAADLADAGKAAALGAGRGALQLEQTVTLEALGQPLRPFLPGLALDLARRALVIFLMALGALGLAAWWP